MSQLNVRDASKMLFDEYGIKILVGAFKKPRTTQEMADDYCIPIAVCYRRVAALEKMGLLELIDSGRNGLLFPPGDTEQMKKALVQVLENTKFGKSLADNAWDRARRLYTSEKMVEETLAVYRRVLETAPSGKI